MKFNPNFFCCIYAHPKLLPPFFILLLQQLVDSAQAVDLVFSPFSVWSLLACISEGASLGTLTELKNVMSIRDASVLGEAYDKIYRALVIEGSKADTVDLKVFQGLFINKSLSVEQSFTNVIRDKYHAEKEPFDSSQPKTS